MVDILKVLKESEVTKTRVVYSANLNFKRANQYLDSMIQMGLVEKPSNKYNITETGNNYLKMMSKVNSIIVDQNFWSVTWRPWLEMWCIYWRHSRGDLLGRCGLSQAIQRRSRESVRTYQPRRLRISTVLQGLNNNHNLKSGSLFMNGQT